MSTITNDIIELLELQNEQHYSDTPFKEMQKTSQEYYKRDVLKDYKLTAVNKGFIKVFDSSELIPLKKAIMLRQLLSFLKSKYGELLDKKSQERLSKNYSVLNSILNSTVERGYSFPEKEPLHIQKNTSYGYTKGFNHGRLYSSTVSITQLSREFRYLLFKDLYHDIDIVNAHPSILFNFACKQNIDCQALGELVKDRTKFYDKIKLEYEEEVGKDFTSQLNIKRLALAVLNSHKQKYKSDSLTQLAKDMFVIRQTLKDELYIEGSSFKRAIDSRLTDESDENKLLNKIQSLYCFDEETKTIMAFKDYFEKEAAAPDSVVPFFDGLFILKDEYSMQEWNLQLIRNYELSDIIDSFNSTSNLSMTEKTIEPDFKLLNPDSLDNFSEYITQLGKLSKSETHELITSSNILPQDMFNDILESKFGEACHNNKFEDVSFDYETLKELQYRAEECENMFIDVNMKEDLELINRECLTSPL